MISNTVANDSTFGNGGGLYLERSSITLINNFITDNRLLYSDNFAARGSGLYIAGRSPRLLHNTVTRKSGGDGSGIHVTGIFGSLSNVALTNTILVSHTVGITIVAGNTAALEATLWGTDNWANLTDWGGAGTIITGMVNIWDAPAFVNPDAGDYHIGLGSAAIDAGVNAGVHYDIDGEPRPADTGSDIGADEHYRYVYLPLIPEWRTW